MVDSLLPVVERAVGLAFKARPAWEMTSRETVRSYLLAKVEKEFPPARLEGIQAAYRLLGLIPDTLDLRVLLLDLYQEQVAGYYEPDSARLYAVRGSDPAQLRLVMAHEMVHALQHQYLPVDTLIGRHDDADRAAAAQAVLEGHATVASVRILAPDRNVTDDPTFWEEYRTQVRTQQRRMPVFASAPLVLREGLLFPYLAGAEFMQWWRNTQGSALPSREAMPRSSEQILHPERYALGDEPVAVRFAGPTDAVLYEDSLGEIEVHILLAVLRGADQIADDQPLGWGGDRYRVTRTPAGPALVWYSVWDNQPAAARFRLQLEDRLTGRASPGYRIEVAGVELGGRSGVRLVHAPAEWAGWQRVQ
jgi:hypothetical protein